MTLAGAWTRSRWRRWAPRWCVVAGVALAPAAAGAVTVTGAGASCAELVGYEAAALSLSIQGVNGDIRLEDESCRVERTILSARVESRTETAQKLETIVERRCHPDGAVLVGCYDVPVTRPVSVEETREVTVQESEWVLRYSAYASGSGAAARAFPATPVSFDVTVRGEQPDTPTGLIADAAYRRLYDRLLVLARPDAFVTAPGSSGGAVAVDRLSQLQYRCQRESNAEACEDAEVERVMQSSQAEAPSISLLERACERSGRGCLALAHYTAEPALAAALRQKACERDKYQCLPAALWAPGGDTGAEGRALLDLGCAAGEEQSCKKRGALELPGLLEAGWVQLEGAYDILVKVPDGLVQSDERVPPAYVHQVPWRLVLHRLEGSSVALRYVVSEAPAQEWFENVRDYYTKEHAFAGRDFQIFGADAKVRKQGCRTGSVEVCWGTVTGTRFGEKGRWGVITASIPRAEHGVAVLVEGTPKDLAANAALIERVKAGFMPNAADGG